MIGAYYSSFDECQGPRSIDATVFVTAFKLDREEVCYEKEIKIFRRRQRMDHLFSVTLKL